MIDFSARSKLENTIEIAEGIAEILAGLFLDYMPIETENDELQFVIFSQMKRGIHEDEDINATILRRWNSFEDIPLQEWRANLTREGIRSVTEQIFQSRGRPDTQIIGARYFETLVRDESLLKRKRRPSSQFTTIHSENGINYRINVGTPSVSLLLRCAIRKEGFDKFGSYIFDGQQLCLYLRSLEKVSDKNSPSNSLSAFELLRIVAQPDLLSLTVEADGDTSLEELEQLTTAVRSRIAFEASVVYVPIYSIDSIYEGDVQPGMIRQISLVTQSYKDKVPVSPGERLAGKLRKVPEECSLRYLRAMAARDAFSAFMSYYHIIEYRMEYYWAQDLKIRVDAACGIVLNVDESTNKNELTQQAAGYLSIPPAQLRFTELRAVQALMRRGVNIFYLQGDLMRHFSHSLDYFATTHIEFADVDFIDLRYIDAITTNEEMWDLLDKLGHRIYMIRCAITHSKPSRSNYGPYRDDLALAREIGIVRLVAEQLIYEPEEWL